MQHIEKTQKIFTHSMVGTHCEGGPVLTSSIVFRRLIEWFACARLSESHLPRSYAVTFPKRSLPWLFTNAALGGLKPAPASRLRGAYPHLLCSCAHFLLKCARGALCYGYLNKTMMPSASHNSSKTNFDRSRSDLGYLKYFSL